MKKLTLVEKFSVNSISTYIRLLVVISTLVTTIVIATAISIHEVRTFKQIRIEQSQSYLKEQKDFINDLVNSETEYIKNQKIQFDRQTQKKIEQSVQDAYSQAEKIYNKYYQTLSENALKDLIINMISSLEAHNKYSKVFINTLSGHGVYYPEKPEHSGTYLVNLKDMNGNYVIKAELDFLKDKNEGFLKYAPSSGCDSIPQRKVTFVKKFGHFNWYFGSKGYLEDYYDDFKSEISKKVSSVRFRHGGYIFVNDVNGNPIAMDGQVYRGNFNFFDGSDLEKQRVFELELKTAQSAYPDGGYFTYEWEKINSNKPSPKISFVKLFKPCNWLIGAGFYLDEIDEDLKIQQNKLQKSLIEDIIQTVIILVLILSAQFYIIYRFNKKYDQDFSHFNRFFKLGKGNYQTIDNQELNFTEFKQMGIIANEMIEEQKKIHAKLVKEQKKAQESDRLKTAFLANMSHEIRTPMNSILGFSELINDPLIDDETKQNFTDIIIENGQHLLGLINDIIDISKIEADQLTISKRRFRLDLLIENTEKQFMEELAKSEKPNVKFIVNSQLPVNCLLNSDEFRLKQVLVNLIGNAIKFTHRGVIKLSVSKTKDKIIFEVSDTGIGISKEDQKNIFQRFVQAKMSPGKNYGGTGLGLAISQKLVNLLGGEISVNSKKGKGSEFHFYIPI